MDAFYRSRPNYLITLQSASSVDNSPRTLRWQGKFLASESIPLTKSRGINRLRGNAWPARAKCGLVAGVRTVLHIFKPNPALTRGGPVTQKCKQGRSTDVHSTALVRAHHAAALVL